VLFEQLQEDEELVADRLAGCGPFQAMCGEIDQIGAGWGSV
jgi:hypothetical protein